MAYCRCMKNSLLRGSRSSYQVHMCLCFVFQSFHTPCFGDEDFDITSLSLPSGTVDNLSSIQPTISDIDPAALHPHHTTFNNSIMSSPNNNMTPQFPPENIEMPDISMSNSVTSANHMISTSVPSFSNNNGVMTTTSTNSHTNNGKSRESSEESSDDSLPLAQVCTGT